MGGECGREGGGQDGVEWGGKWDNCNSIINKYIKKKKKKKNNLTVTRREGGGDNVGRVFKNYYKGHMDKTKGEGGSKGRRWVWLGSGEVVGRKCRQL